MKILLTGFEAFGDVEENPTQVIVERFAKQADTIDYAELVCEIIPVEYELSGQRIRELIDRHQPDAVVMTGVAARRKKINIEFWARNVRTASIPDNSGVLLDNQPINPDEPIEHFLPATLPVFSLYSKLNNAGIPVERSNNAGGYICNNIFYSAVDYLMQGGRDDVLAGFVHIPTFDAIDKETMMQAYKVILQEVTQTKTTKHRQAHMYMSPAIEKQLNILLEKLPDNPVWCTLMDNDTYSVGHVGEKVDMSRQDSLGISFNNSNKMVASAFHGNRSRGEFSYAVVGSNNGSVTLLVWITEVHFLIINWRENASLGTVYMASKAFLQLLQPLRELLSELA